MSLALDANGEHRQLWLSSLSLSTIFGDIGGRPVLSFVSKTAMCSSTWREAGGLRVYKRISLTLLLLYMTLFLV